MGKASSSKKVARAAGIGGGRSLRRQTPWAYFGIIALIVALGLAGTAVSRHQRDNAIAQAGETGGVKVGVSNFEVYTVDICGTFTYVKAPAADPHGITAYNYTPTAPDKPLTDGGVIQIDPTSADYAGQNATLGKFADAVGMILNAGQLQMPGGKPYVANSTTCNGTAGVVYVKQFATSVDTTGKLYNGAKGQLPKLNPIDVPIGPPVGSSSSPLITIAFVPPAWATAACPAASSTSADPATVTGCIPPPNSDLDTELSAAQTAAQAATSTSSATTLP